MFKLKGSLLVHQRVMHQPSTAGTAISSEETRDEESEDVADIDLSPSDLNHDGDVEKGEIVLDDTKLEHDLQNIVASLKFVTL